MVREITSATRTNHTSNLPRNQVSKVQGRTYKTQQEHPSWQTKVLYIFLALAALVLPFLAIHHFSQPTANSSAAILSKYKGEKGICPRETFHLSASVQCAAPSNLVHRIQLAQRNTTGEKLAYVFKNARPIATEKVHWIEGSAPGYVYPCVYPEDMDSSAVTFKHPDGRTFYALRYTTSENPDLNRVMVAQKKAGSDRWYSYVRYCFSTDAHRNHFLGGFVEDERALVQMAQLNRGEETASFDYHHPEVTLRAV